MSMEMILKAVAAGTLSTDDAAKLLPQQSGEFKLKVSEKGCVQIRGIEGINRQFGLCLYAKALQGLFAHKDEIEAFILANKGTLSFEKAVAEKTAA